MEKELKRLVEISEEMLEYTKGMHKLLREMNVRVIDKLGNL